MDDLPVTGEKDSDFSKFKEQMMHYFEMSNLGDVSRTRGHQLPTVMSQNKVQTY